MVERGEPVNQEILKKIYRELNKKYYGNGIHIDEEIDYEWARIPHFYNSFYVYKYATGFSAAIAISTKILKEGALAQQKYKKFLSSGSSDYSLNLLRLVDVDLTKTEPILDALNVFEKLLDKYRSFL